MELRLRRVAKGVRVTDLAHRMGLKTHSRVSQIESLRQVTPRTAARYLAALETFPNVENKAA
jgi:transcriptional regulator with XRE-family HTH domain